VVPVVRHGGQRWAVLSTEAPTDAAHGPLTLHDRHGALVVASALRPEAVAAAYRQLEGTTLVLDAGGTAGTCTVTLGAPSLLARINPHFGMVNHWDGLDDEGHPTRPPTSDEAVAREALATYDDGRLLVAPLTGTGCDEALWGYAAGQATAVFVPSIADPSTHAAALAAQRATLAWRRLQRQYREDGPSPDRPAVPGSKWDELASPPVVTVWRAAQGGREFVTVRSEVPREGCAMFSGALWTVWERVDGRLVARSERTEAMDFAPATAADVDGDGAPEFVSSEGIVSLGPRGYSESVSLRIADHDCPC